MKTGCSWNSSDFLPEIRPGSDELFQAGTVVELNQTLTQWQPVIRGPLNDVVRNVYHQYNGTALVRKLPCFTMGIIRWLAKKEWAGLDVHGESLFAFLAAGLPEVRVRSVLQDLLRTDSGCTMQ